ncbi:MAG: protein translocase subunit SecF [Rhodospirillales bacterium]|nr:protein translocase subunit SecF [Rhodospirillales bacterium]
MRGLYLIPSNLKISFMPKKTLFFVFSTLIILASIGMFMSKGLNYGIDFKGGILIEIQTQGPADIAAMRAQLGELDLGEVALQEFGDPTEVLIRIQKQEGGEGGQDAAVSAIKAVLGDSVEYRRTEFVGPKVSSELLMDGVLAVGLAIAAILAYIWLRFEWQFGIGAVVALLHDVLATVGIFSLMELEFNLSTVAAVLTIAGYSINDTVVVYDRVRENLRKYKKKPLMELLNDSVNQTLSRTLMTSVTTLIALLALYTLGGAVIRDFSFAMIFGVIIGTYSSICVAVPLLLHLKLDRVQLEEEGNDEAGDGPGNEKDVPAVTP